MKTKDYRNKFKRRRLGLGAKIILIYFLGVTISWGILFNHLSNHVNKNITYGDIAFCTTMSLFSWVTVVSNMLVEFSEISFWDTSFNK